MAVEALGDSLGIYATGETGGEFDGKYAGIRCFGKIGVLIYTKASCHLRLQPGPTDGAPSVGDKGDMYCDKSGRLWFKGAKGWKQIA